jgi:hypothetical protein
MTRGSEWSEVTRWVASGVRRIRHIERVDVLGGLIHEYRHAA